MSLRTLNDAELERRLNADPDNLQLILEAARRFPRTAERADEADTFEEAHEEAKDEISELKAEIETLKDELKVAEERGDDLQKELDESPTQSQMMEAQAQITALQAEVTRLNTVLELVADA